jgi:histidinol phosphatase-like PHP family hydrolase
LHTAIGRQLVKQPEQKLSNSQIAELLAREAEEAAGHIQRAFRRAARRAFLWPEEAAELVGQGRSLSAELPAVGPYLEQRIRRWIERPPAPIESPEIRSGFLTLTEARATLAEDPSWVRRIRGDLQMHTEWSDGSGSIRQMAEAALERGYEYIAITDHSKGLKIAGGIDARQLREQAEEIEAVNCSLRSAGAPLQLLRSIELNLNPAGEGDMEEASLADLDLVLGCFHSSLRKKEDQTNRYVAALHNPSIDILGHPRGRIYNFRLGLNADWPRVFGVAAELDKAVEIDAYPDRQDLSPSLLAMARAAGCRISLGTDAHDPAQLRFMDYGAASALRARIPPERILNCMQRQDLLEWTRRRRTRMRAA